MDQDKRLLHLPPLQMRLSMRSDCPYISGRTEQRVAVDISENPSLHDELARAGFRRVETGPTSRFVRNARPAFPGGWV